MGYFIISIWHKIIIFDIESKSVIVLKRMIFSKKFEWKVDKEPGFSDIKEINVIEQCNEDGSYTYNTKLIDVKGNSQKISSGDNLETKEFAIKLCKIIDVNGYYMDKYKKSNILYEAKVVS